MGLLVHSSGLLDLQIFYCFINYTCIVGMLVLVHLPGGQESVFQVLVQLLLLISSINIEVRLGYQWKVSA